MQTSKIFAALFCAVGCFAGIAPAQSPVTVAVDAAAPGLPVAGEFSGLSLEMKYVLPETNGVHFFSTNNRPLIAIFKTLGIKSLRVGGNTADRPTVPVPVEADVDSLFAFAQAADVKVIYTLRLNRGEMATAVKMANYISQHYQNRLACFAIGNEPNVFSTNYDVYITEWKRYAAQITAPANSPGAKFCGPSVSPGHETWSARFANELAGSGLIAFVSQHDYPGGDARRATNAVAARDRILSPVMATNYAKFAANFVPAVLSNGLAYRFEEANSFYDGGALDVSDTFAAALWALDYQWWWASRGMSGINFHTGDKVAARDMNKPCRYAAFWTSDMGYNVHPIGYGIKAFDLGGHGNILPLTVTNTDEVNLTAYASRTTDKNLFVTLINREHGTNARSANITLAVPEKIARGQIIYLAAPDGDVAAKTGVTLGGAEIKDDGSWKGKWKKLKPGKGGNFTVKIPAASAAVVRLSPE
jgi:hypothetical protein